MPDSTIELHLTPRHLQALGLLAARWSFFETEMGFSISALGYDIEHDQSMLPPFKRRANRWLQLARKRWTGDTLREIEIIIQNAHIAHENRCVALHGRVHGDPHGQSEFMQIDYHEHKQDDWYVTFLYAKPEGLEHHAAEIERLTVELISFNQQHLPAAPKSLPRTFSAPQ